MSQQGRSQWWGACSGCCSAPQNYSVEEGGIVYRDRVERALRSKSAIGVEYQGGRHGTLPGLLHFGRWDTHVWTGSHGAVCAATHRTATAAWRALVCPQAHQAAALLSLAMQPAGQSGPPSSQPARCHFSAQGSSSQPMQYSSTKSYLQAQHIEQRSKGVTARIVGETAAAPEACRAARSTRTALRAVRSQCVCVAFGGRAPAVTHA